MRMLVHHRDTFFFHKLGVSTDRDAQVTSDRCDKLKTFLGDELVDDVWERIVAEP